jgi:hypothetical protein
MNSQIEFNIQITPTNDGWYAEATAVYPQAKIITATGYSLEDVLEMISREITAWISNWPEHMRPGYKLPVFLPGVIVRHIGLPETVFLEVVDGPIPSVVSPEETNLYHVKMPSGEISIAKGDNLRGPYGKEDIYETA